MNLYQRFKRFLYQQAEHEITMRKPQIRVFLTKSYIMLPFYYHHLKLSIIANLVFVAAIIICIACSLDRYFRLPLLDLVCSIINIYLHLASFVLNLFILLFFRENFAMLQTHAQILYKTKNLVLSRMFKYKNTINSFMYFINFMIILLTTPFVFGFGQSVLLKINCLSSWLFVWKKFYYIKILKTKLRLPNMSEILDKLMARQKDVVIRDCSQLNTTECVICLTAFVKNEKAKKLSCKGEHVFHHDCIRDWLKVKRTCPLCKTRIN